MPNFVLTRGAVRAIDLLNENLYNKIFTEGNLPSSDILLTYKILFQLLKKQEFLALKDDKVKFWKKVCDFFVKEGNGKTGALINSLIKDIDFSDENIYKLIKLAGNDVSKITPTYFSKFCGTTGLIIFLIKDAFEYAGIVIDKKTLPKRLFKNYNYALQVINVKLEKMKKMQLECFS